MQVVTPPGRHRGKSIRSWPVHALNRRPGDRDPGQGPACRPKARKTHLVRPQSLAWREPPSRRAGGCGLTGRHDRGLSTRGYTQKTDKKKGCRHPVAPAPLVSPEVLDAVFVAEGLLLSQHTLFFERLPQLTCVEQVPSERGTQHESSPRRLVNATRRVEGSEDLGDDVGDDSHVPCLGHPGRGCTLGDLLADDVARGELSGSGDFLCLVLVHL